jgi:CRP-like cAMP-binding protein
VPELPEVRSATVLAHKDCEVVEIAKPVLARSLKEHPELLAQLSEMLAKRRMETEGALGAVGATDAAQVRQNKYAEGFLGRLKAFFEL